MKKEKYMAENLEIEEEKEETKAARERIFLKGIYCGVLLTFVCMFLATVFFRWRINQRFEQKTVVDEEECVQLELDTADVLQKVEELERVINERFMGEIDSRQVEEAIYSGMLWGLGDPYSEYYSAESLKAMEESISGSYSGIGATLMQDAKNGEITVVSCFEDSPAAEAGILPGDIIYGTNGEAYNGKDLTELITKIKTEQGDTVSLMIRRGTEELELQVERRAIEVPTVEGRMLEDEIGYLQILEFDDVTTEQFKEKLEELQNEGMKKLIFDVRDNPGGNLEVVCDILDLILPEGRIVYTEDKNGNRQEYISDAEHKLEMPMAVLINENSASASEIFAGALQDYTMGTLIGKTTYGKGIVQRLFDFTDGTGMKLTVAKYYTPNGNDIHEKGIQPDIEIALPQETENMTEIPPEQDTQLQEAISILTEE